MISKQEAYIKLRKLQTEPLEVIAYMDEKAQVNANYVNHGFI